MVIVVNYNLDLIFIDWAIISSSNNKTALTKLFDNMGISLKSLLKAKPSLFGRKKQRQTVKITQSACKDLHPVYTSISWL